MTIEFILRVEARADLPGMSNEEEARVGVVGVEALGAGGIVHEVHVDVGVREDALHRVLEPDLGGRAGLGIKS